MLGISSLCLAAGLLLYALAGAYATLVLGMGLVGFGSGMLEGLTNPLVQDQHPDDSGRYLNMINGFWSVGVLATVLLVGELLTREVPWRLVAAGLSGLSALSGLLFFAFARHEHTHARQTLAESSAHFKNVLKDRGFWIFAGAMIFAGATEMGFTFWSATLIQVWLGSTPRAGGVGTACFAAGMVAGRFACGHFVAQKHLARLILLSAGAGFCVSLLIFVVHSLAALCVVLFLAGLSVACFWPSIQSLAAERLSCDHTMLFILLSCAGIPACGLVSWVMGIIADHSSVRVSFAILPLMFLLLAGLIRRAVKSGY